MAHRSMTPAQSHVLADLFEERIDTLMMYRRWHRTRPQSLRHVFVEIAAEHRIELRALLRLRSQVKRAQRGLDREEQRKALAFICGGQAVARARGITP